MRVQLASIDLIGGGRRVEFGPGLNVVTGPITTGKTTFLRLCRALLNTGLELRNYPREARNNISVVAGQVVLGDSLYSIVRPLVTTENAKVDIAGPFNAWRLPADYPDRTSDMSYNQWLLRTLGLPELRVPSAPTQPASEPTPVTINDYFLYCRLTQSEIDSSIFASSDNYRDIKRRYVFEILYGIFSAETAMLQEELRTVLTEIRQLDVQTGAFQRFLEGTPWVNRATLLRDLDQAREELAGLDSNAESIASSAQEAVPNQELRIRLQELDTLLDEQRTSLQRERASIEQLHLLMNQLDSQIGKITRSIVAASYLQDLEFQLCPRCGTPVDIARGAEETCVLCLQSPTVKPFDRPTLIAEQDRLAGQVKETRELIRAREALVERFEDHLNHLSDERQSVANELDYLTQTYVSDRASTIASIAAHRATAKVRVEQLQDYLNLLARLDHALRDLATLEERRREIESQLTRANSRTELSEQRIQHLEAKFGELVEIFRLPRLEGPEEVRIDRRNYLPVLYGRRFGELSSQGLLVLVNVALALAHHETSIDLDLGLPQVLFIDGLTSNLGHEGEDLLRVNAVYNYLARLSDTMGNDLQIIVADNDVPPQAERFVQLRLGEEDRLIRAERA